MKFPQSDGHTEKLEIKKVDSQQRQVNYGKRENYKKAKGHIPIIERKEEGSGE